MKNIDEIKTTLSGISASLESKETLFEKCSYSSLTVRIEAKLSEKEQTIHQVDLLQIKDTLHKLNYEYN